MKILKLLLYTILGLGLLWTVLGLFATKDYHIERSIEINAPKDTVYKHARYFKNFESWSPWAALDPNMKVTIEGTDGEVGATYKWSGNDDVGEGEQVITARTADRIDIKVHLKGWMETTFPTYMVFEEMGEKTKVTWVADMHIGFPWNGFAMFTNMDIAVGKDYAFGLEKLQTVCEYLARKKYRGYEIAEVSIEPKYYLGQRKTLHFDSIPAFYANTISMAMAAIQQNEIELTGAPSGLYWTYDMEANSSDMAAAIPIVAEEFMGDSLSVILLDSGQAIVIEYFGAYGETGEAHFAMDDYMTEQGLQNIPPVIEEYVTTSDQEPDTAKWLTKIIYYVEPKPVETEAAEQTEQ